MKNNKLAKSEKFEIIREYIAIPYAEIVRILNKLVYGSICRVVIQMLFLSGCRITELNNMNTYSLICAKGKYYVNWKLGKNQKGTRIEKLDKRYIQEIKYYRDNNRIYGKRLFGITGQSFVRYFNKFIRPTLGKVWNDQILVTDKKVMKLEYKYQLKGFRKSHSILKFAKRIKQFHDVTAATELTCADMQHSSKNITTRHYLKDYAAIDGQKYAHLDPIQVLGQANQTRLTDYMDEFLEYIKSVPKKKRIQQKINGITKRSKGYFRLDKEDIKRLNLLKKSRKRYAKLDTKKIAHIELKKGLTKKLRGRIFDKK